MKVSEEGLGELSYLQCIVKETLRLHTPGTLLVPRQSQEHYKILGYDVPKGTTVLINARAISRDPECWDEQPERFMGTSWGSRNVRFSYISVLPRALDSCNLCVSK